MMHLLTSPEAWAALLTLTSLEIVLGIDNVIVLSVIVSRIPEKQAHRARQIGLALALVFRIILLSVLVWLIGLTAPVFSAAGYDFSWRDLILIGGGLFLIAKATHEIHGEVEAGEEGEGPHAVSQSFFVVVVQLIAIDLIFSLDSIITAIGMVNDIEIMIAAVIIAMGGGLLSVHEKQVAVPAALLKVGKEARFSIELTEDQLKAAPAFDPSKL